MVAAYETLEGVTGYVRSRLADVVHLVVNLCEQLSERLTHTHTHTHTRQTRTFSQVILCPRGQHPAQRGLWWVPWRLAEIDWLRGGAVWLHLVSMEGRVDSMAWQLWTLAGGLDAQLDGANFHWNQKFSPCLGNSPQNWKIRPTEL
jgi:hypothetical protein